MRLEYRYRRARPTLHRRDPRKAQRLQAIEAVLAEEDPYTEVFFADEVDVDLNPQIGSAWMRRGEQTAVPTPGQNEKHYIAGALHAHTGRLVWVEHPRKNSVLFVKLLEQLRSHYRRANRIVLILDNYRIHKSQLVERCWRIIRSSNCSSNPPITPGSTSSNAYGRRCMTRSLETIGVVPCSSCVGMSQDSSTSSSLSRERPGCRTFKISYLCATRRLLPSGWESRLRSGDPATLSIESGASVWQQRGSSEDREIVGRKPSG